ncbi:MAG: hypothetical protein IKW15_08645 [Bacteroidales bacterium]|nr:hypothetical protein [Bacteroidales bacterium]
MLQFWWRNWGAGLVLLRWRMWSDISSRQKLCAHESAFMHKVDSNEDVCAQKGRLVRRVWQEIQ